MGQCIVTYEGGAERGLDEQRKKKKETRTREEGSANGIPITDNADTPRGGLQRLFVFNST